MILQALKTGIHLNRTVVHYTKSSRTVSPYGCGGVCVGVAAALRGELENQANIHLAGVWIAKKI